MVTVVVFVEITAIGLLYRTAMTAQRARLQETVQSHARLIEAIFRFDNKYSKDYPGGVDEATLSQIIDAHQNYKGFGKTGEFTLSKKEGDKIVFLLSHRHSIRQQPKPVHLDSNLAEPMQMALSGKSGTMIGFDYRGKKVLAAYEPVEEIELGIVAKIDLSEIRAPFIWTSLISGAIGLIALLCGALIFIRVTNPLVTKLQKTIQDLKTALREVNVLSGLLPICASCKKIRDDKGYWNQIEIYIKDRSDADFSHSICPECAEKLYPELGLSFTKNNQEDSN